METICGMVMVVGSEKSITTIGSGVEHRIFECERCRDLGSYMEYACRHSIVLRSVASSWVQIENMKPERMTIPQNPNKRVLSNSTKLSFQHMIHHDEFCSFHLTLTLVYESESISIFISLLLTSSVHQNTTQRPHQP